MLLLILPPSFCQHFYVQLCVTTTLVATHRGVTSFCGSAGWQDDCWQNDRGVDGEGGAAGA